MNNDKGEKLKNNSFKKLNKFFKEFQKFMTSLLKKYNLEAKFLNNLKFVNPNIKSKYYIS